MAVKLLFEDNENTPSSILLKNSMHGDNIYFASGNSQVLNKLKSIYNDGDTVFIFFDVSPNNKWTIKFYNNIVQTIKGSKQYKNIYIIPIICIEYYICKFLKEYNYIVIKNEVIKQLANAIIGDTFDYSKIPMSILKVNKLNNSLEKMYKHILSNQAMKCMNNKNDDSYDLYGMFYKCDCRCERKYCSINCTDSLEIKSERLYTSLPVFAVSSPEHREIINRLGIHISNIDINDIYKEVKQFYDDICRSMGTGTIKIAI